MKTSEDKMVNALFRADMISRNNSDPGSNWEGSSLFKDIIFFLIGLCLLRAFLFS